MTKIRSWFLTGILVMTPLILTIYVAWAFITFVDNLVVPLVPFDYRPSNYLPFSIPGLGLIIVFIFNGLLHAKLIVFLLNIFFLIMNLINL